MSKTIISFFFITLFLAFLSAPTLISLVEKKHDVSTFFSLAEEENKESESSKTFEIQFFEIVNQYSLSFSTSKEKISPIYNRSYTTFKSECISPPPEHNIA